MSAGNKIRFPVLDTEREAMKFAAAKSHAAVASIRGALGELELRSREVEEAAKGAKEQKYKEIGKIYKIGLAVVCDKKLQDELDHMLSEAKIKFSSGTSVFSKVQRLQPSGRAVSRALTSHDALAMREAARLGLNPKRLVNGLLEGEMTINKLAASFRNWFNEQYPDYATKNGEQRKIVLTANNVKILAVIDPRHHRRLVRYNRSRRPAILVTVDVTDPTRPFTVEVSAAKSTTLPQEKTSRKAETRRLLYRRILRSGRLRRRPVERRRRQ